MRLAGFGGFTASTEDDLAALCAELDRLGLAAIPAPHGLASMSDDECFAFGEAARRLGLVVGETGMPEITDRAHRIQDADRPGRRAG